MPLKVKVRGANPERKATCCLAESFYTKAKRKNSDIKSVERIWCPYRVVNQEKQWKCHKEEITITALTGAP